MQQLLGKLGYSFQNPDLLRQALTHPSFGPENNQRLEFLGDSVLQICIADLLYRTYPEYQEGKLTTMRTQLVDEQTLSSLGRALGLGALLRMQLGEESTGGRERSGNLCDAMEAVLAAVYLDGGFAAAQQVIATLFADIPGLIAAHGGNDKNDLLIWAQARALGQPVYEIIDTSGPMHRPVFTAAVSLAGQRLAIGTGHSKREAEKAAAAVAMEQLKNEPFADSINRRK